MRNSNLHAGFAVAATRRIKDTHIQRAACIFLFLSIVTFRSLFYSAIKAHV